MADDVDLGGAFALPPERAIKWFEGKGYTIAWDWRAVAKATAAYAFSVAGVARADVLATIRDALQSALDDGTTYQTFRSQMRERLTELGWWGTKLVVDADTGETKRVNLSSPRRLDTIYRTNLQSAYMAGRYQALMDMAATRPYWEYVAVLDDRTRPAHRAMSGRVFRATDPIWELIFPPNGYNCRCRVRALSADDLKARGLSVEDSSTMTTTATNTTRDGGVETRTVLQLPGGQRFAPDVGFDRNPALAAPWGDVVLPSRLVVLGDSALSEVLQTFSLSPAKRAAWSAWVDDVAGGPIQHSWQVAGYLDARTMDELRAFAAKNADLVKAPIDWPIQIEDSVVAGAKAVRHTLAGNALSVAEWEALPESLAKPLAVLVQRDNGNLVYVFADPANAAKRIKVVVELGRIDDRTRQTLNAVRAAFRVQADSLQDAKMFQTLWGKV